MARHQSGRVRLVHSSVANEDAAVWLDAVRRNEPEMITGVPPGGARHLVPGAAQALPERHYSPQKRPAGFAELDPSRGLGDGAQPRRLDGRSQCRASGTQTRHMGTFVRCVTRAKQVPRTGVLGQYDHARQRQRRLSTTRPSACTENWRRRTRRLCAKTTSDHLASREVRPRRGPRPRYVPAALPACRGAVISALSESMTRSPPSYSDPSTKLTLIEASQPSQWKGNRGLEVVEYLRTKR